MDALFSFAAALVALRLAVCWRGERRIAWAGGAVLLRRCGGGDGLGRRPRLGRPVVPRLLPRRGLLSAPLLGIGSLICWRPALGGSASACSTPGSPSGSRSRCRCTARSTSTAVPHAQDHIDALPRVVAIAASSLGTLAVVVVACATLRSRPRQGALIVGAVAAAGLASALTQTAVAAAAAAFAVAAVLLYLGVSAPRRGTSSEYQATTRSAND